MYFMYLGVHKPNIQLNLCVKYIKYIACSLTLYDIDVNVMSQAAIHGA